MSKTQAERAREYRNRKRDAKRDGVTHESVTIRHENVTPEELSNGVTVELPEPVTDVVVGLPVTMTKPGMPYDCMVPGCDKKVDGQRFYCDSHKNTPTMDQLPAVDIGDPYESRLARARRTDPDLINWGPWMNADELEAYRAAHGLSKYHNRSPIPGDWDYVGVAV